MDRLSAFARYVMSGLLGRWRDVLAIGAIGASLVLGLTALRFAAADHGIAFDQLPDRIIVSEISPWGAAARSSLRPGMVVVQLNGAPVGALPRGLEQRRLAPAEWGSLLAEPAWSVEAVPAQEYERQLRSDSTEISGAATFFAPGTVGEQTWPTVLAAFAALGLISWWLLGHGATGIYQLAAPFAAAATVPLFLVPYAMTWGYTTQLVITLALPLSFLPFAESLASLLPPRRRRNTRIAAAGGALVALVGGILLAQTGSSVQASLLAAALAGCVFLAPAVGIYHLETDTTLGRADQSPTLLELAAIAITPVLAALILASRDPGLPWLLIVWIVIVIAVARLAVTPLTRAVRRSRLQRDLAIQATEAERARIATDLHDAALQELTMLAMRLDAKGDAESAGAAREVVERVREICGDLRLPLLDDFGVGPALEWLVERLERLTSGRIRLEQHNGGRLPPDVELAIFRVAQEAIANAIRHGRPPVIVRFESEGNCVSLSVEDCGGGLAPDAAELAQLAGHFGLLNMHQRAEQVGALLEVRRSSSGGTYVGLEWTSS